MRVIKKIPRDTSLDSTCGFLREGYLFISNRMQGYNTEIFYTRFVGKKVVFLMGKEAAELFYNEKYFKRKGVAPMRVQKTLFGKKAIQGLDGTVHKRRKSLFMSLLTPEYEEMFLDLFEMNCMQYAHEWEKKSSVQLYKESQKVLFESVCQWVGISYDKSKIEEYAQYIGLMIYGFGRIGKTYRRGKEARKQVEKWVKESIVEVRRGKLSVDQSLPLYQMSMYEEAGKLLDAQIAAVELINLIRPIVAIATYLTFEAVAITTYPTCRKKLQKRDPAYLEMFCQEVRRFYPFGPFVGAKGTCDFVWKNYLIKKDTLVILDLYGTNHDKKLWDRPNQFQPERFKSREACLYDMIPQGGGKVKSGHRCAGDHLTLKVMELFADFMVNHLTYDVPRQNLRYSLQRIPTLPKSGFVIRNVQIQGK